MTTISYNEARQNLANLWDQTVSMREPVMIERSGHEAVVLVPASEWKGLQETIHLLRSPANSQRLIASLARLGES
ncbi:MAG: type II toxin-antitoxin system prevent-host-death family antitoxin [Luteolibacter sp.]